MFILAPPTLLQAQWRFERIGLEHGLPHSRISALAQDAKGYVWIGTFSGLARWDGHRAVTWHHDPDDRGSLPGDNIWALREDHNGVLWVGMEGGGLCRYDPRMDRFVRYLNRADDSTTLSQDRVSLIFEDGKQRLWVGTSGAGLNLYQSAGDHFRRYSGEDNPPGQTWGNYLRAALSLPDGRMLVGTVGSGAAVFDPSTGLGSRIFHGCDLRDIGCENILDIMRDRHGRYWFATSEGVAILDVQSRRFSFLTARTGGERQLSSNDVYDVHEDRDGRVWIATQAGLDILDPVRNSVAHLRHDPLDPYSLWHDSVYRLMEDRGGNIWIATHRGVNIYSPLKNRFRHIQHTTDPQSLSHDDVSAVAPALRSGRIWIGTFGGGLNLLDPRSGRTLRYTMENTPLSEDDILSVYEDADGIVWIGTYGGGLNRFDPSRGEWRTYREEIRRPGGLTHDDIWVITEDSEHRLWVGTNFGLNILDRGTDSFRRIVSASPDPHRIRHNRIRAVYDDGRSIWVGTEGGGIYRYGHDLEQQAHYSMTASGEEHLRSDEISCFTGTSDGCLWAGTVSGGLTLVDRVHGPVFTLTREHGLPDNTICALREDAQGALWIVTSSGLARLNLRDGSLQVFGAADGIRNRQFNPRAAAMTEDNILLVGGISGLTSIGDTRVRPPANSGRLVCTDISVLNKPLSFGEDEELDRPVELTQHLTLPYNRNSLSLSFALLEYAAPELHHYRYRFSGVHDDWIDLGNTRTVVGTDLSPGSYTLTVDASDSFGTEAREPIVMHVTITPPFWRSTWAYAFYVLVLVGLLMGLQRLRLNRLRLREQLHRESLEAQHLKEMDGLKSRFFANISHEFRTPLTLILGPLTDLEHRLPEGVMRKTHAAMRRQAERLLALVNQILDLSRLESGAMPLSLRMTDVHSFASGILHSFTALADQRGITLVYRTHEAGLRFPCDRDAVEKILTNLVSNAIRHTRSGGRVTLSIEAAESMLDSRRRPCCRIVVEDSGSGIPAEQLPHVFDRFFSTSTDARGGTGIGLALTRELVRHHGGSIAVESTVGTGSVFRVLLPMDLDSGRDTAAAASAAGASAAAASAAAASAAGVSAVDRTNAGSGLPHAAPPGDRPAQSAVAGADGISDEEVDALAAALPQDAVAGADSSGEELPVLLIVEDHIELREYMRSLFAGQYTVREASDGAEGLEIALAVVPDVIVSDIMMPEMDGFAFTRALRDDARSSHIPLILLTARADGESRLEGLDLGANDYLTKPFEAAELQLKVRNLMQLYRRLRNQTVQQAGYVLEPRSYTSTDQHFLDRIVAFVETHLDDAELSIEGIGDEIGMSRTQLYRKIRALTGLSPSRFVRTIRLDRAREMLEQGAGNVAEIAYATGFGSQAWFTRCYRERFDMTPGAAMKKKE
ncbi:MAG: two-component regulator propeller domain-containing protein [Bacteroidota bacterium]|nr:two-component regulator propeller domain-containing protein [Bacteroidota bacterium]